MKIITEKIPIRNKSKREILRIIIDYFEKEEFIEKVKLEDPYLIITYWVDLK